MYNKMLLFFIRRYKMNIKVNKHGEFDIDISKEELLIILDNYQ